MSAAALLDRPAEVFSSALGGYRDRVRAVRREIVAHERSDSARVLIDQIASDGADARLVAVLAADEPPENEGILCRLYLRDPTRGRCRLVRSEDLEVPAPSAPESEDTRGDLAEELVDRDGRVYRLAAMDHGGLVQLRWTRTPPSTSPETVTLRTVVGALEAYEPARSMTEQAIGQQQLVRELSTKRLRHELRTLSASTIVLNRGLREAVLRRLAQGDSPRAMAERCGHFKDGGRARPSGDGSWLTRRIGLRTESGSQTPTPWVSLDVLEVIAREALGVHPSEVAL